MAFPTEKKEISGALVVATGLILGGLITHAAHLLNIPTPGLIVRRPSDARVEAALRGPACAGDAEGAGESGTPEAPQSARPSKPRPFGAISDKSPSGKSGEASIQVPAVSLAERGRRLEPIDINSATAQELEALDGIGPALASRIIDLRAKKGGSFDTLEELLEVKGIGPATLARIKACAWLATSPGDPQSTLRTSTSSQTDSSSFQR